MRLIASAFVIFALAGLGSAAQAQSPRAQTLKVTYDLSLAGLPLGKADLSSSFYGTKYQMEASAKLTGLAMILTGGKGVAAASGRLGRETPLSSAFAVVSSTSDDQRSVRMGLRGGRVAKVEIDPPLEPRPDRVPVKAEDKKGVVDPMSALLMPALASASLTDPENCNRTIPVFDGASRMNVVLSYAETKNVEVPGYSGPVLVCNVRYVPISGHRAERPATKFMQENRDIAVWLAPVEGPRLLFPLKVAVRTMIGMGEMQASLWSVEEDGKPAQPTRRAVKAEGAITAGAIQ
ncbi:hypothetical protein GGR34_002227 [Microvirga flocculans]|uniref:DUF3108 domain-containing protein n=1 Tax=Microvirga flocculans TaxID=217168 RepID=A0A7W6IGT9_9HYPH|nr:DUF3108 domain-containing protein [Microvirga flocculans]MBB4040570.1 hypothetical protein [Microvirga flocculans]